MIISAKLVALAVGALYLHNRSKAVQQLPDPDRPAAHPPAARVTIPKNERREPLVVQGIDGASFNASEAGGTTNTGTIGGA